MKWTVTLLSAIVVGWQQINIEGGSSHLLPLQMWLSLSWVAHDRRTHIAACRETIVCHGLPAVQTAFTWLGRATAGHRLSAESMKAQCVSAFYAAHAAIYIMRIVAALFVKQGWGYIFHRTVGYEESTHITGSRCSCLCVYWLNGHWLLKFIYCYNTCAQYYIYQNFKLFICIL